MSAAREVRRPLLGAVAATAVALPALVPASADASALSVRRVIAPVVIKRAPAPAPVRTSAPVRYVYGHKLA